MKKVSFITACIMILTITLVVLCSCTKEISSDAATDEGLDFDYNGDLEFIDPFPEINDEQIDNKLDNDIIETEIEKPEIIYKQYILIKVDGLSVRKGSGTQFSVICSFNKGDMLGYYGVENGWYITYVKGVKGYISAGSKYTELYSIPASSDNIEKVINEGLKYLGTPYVYGAVRYHNGSGVLLNGFSINAFDCSSYMQYIYYIGSNTLLGLTTRNQVLQGKFVAKTNIQRGDLIFFTNSSRYYKIGIERVGHVALYLGDNYILHTASDYAVIEQISNQRWKYYIETRRFI